MPLHLLSPLFFNAPAPTYIYTLSLHDALPISPSEALCPACGSPAPRCPFHRRDQARALRSSRKDSAALRSEEHTSELQSRLHLVCRLLLEKKKKKKHI